MKTCGSRKGEPRRGAGALVSFRTLPSKLSRTWRTVLTCRFWPCRQGADILRPVTPRGRSTRDGTREGSRSLHTGDVGLQRTGVGSSVLVTVHFAFLRAAFLSASTANETHGRFPERMACMSQGWRTYFCGSFFTKQWTPRYILVLPGNLLKCLIMKIYLA